MGKTEIRTVISYLHIKGMTTKETHDGIVEWFGYVSPSRSSVKSVYCWVKHAKESIDDDIRLGWPKSVTTDQQDHSLHVNKW